jgi:acyl-CoA synthetase (NDP forming)
MAGVGLNDAMMDKLMPSFENIAKKYTDRVMVMSIMVRPERRHQLEAMGYLIYEDPTRGINAMAALTRYGKAFAAKDGRQALPALPSAATPLASGKALDEAEAKAALAAAGVPVVEEVTVQSAADAAKAAERLGFPIAMKVLSPDILHKSEIGGVVLNVADAAGAAEAFDTIMARAKKAVPDAKIEGVLVAPMIKDGVETIMGVSRDPVFGPVVMFGLGGIFVEIMKDVTFRIDVAREMIRAVKGFPLLDGARGRPKADVEALADALSRLSVYAAANADTLESIDVNPFLVRPAGKGAVAVDALIVPQGVETKGHH